MQTRILSGANDVLGGVPARIVNVRERAERPGGLSGLLVLDDEERVIAVNDEIALNDRRFRLDAIEADRTGGFVFVFSDVLSQRRSLSSLAESLDVHDMPAVSASQFIKALKDLTPALLIELSGGAPAPALIGWTKDSNDTWIHQHPDGPLGPSTRIDHEARFETSDRTVNAGLFHTITRLNPDTVHREEVTGFWRCGDAKLSISTSREEGLSFERFRSRGLENGSLKALLQALNSSRAD